MAFPTLTELDQINRPATILELHGYSYSDDDVDQFERKALSAYEKGDEPLLAQRIKQYAESNGGYAAMARDLGYENADLLRQHIRRETFATQRRTVMENLTRNYDGKIAMPTLQETQLEGFFQAVKAIRKILEPQKTVLELSYERLGVLAKCCQEETWIEAVQANEHETDATRQRLQEEFAQIRGKIGGDLVRADLWTPHELEQLTRDWRPSFDFSRIVLFFDEHDRA